MIDDTVPKSRTVKVHTPFLYWQATKLIIIHWEIRNDKYTVHLSHLNQKVPVLWETEMKKSNYKN